MKCIRKPVDIEYWIFNYPGQSMPSSVWNQLEFKYGKWYIQTIEGNIVVNDGDYILCGFGEMWVEKPDLFKEKYEVIK